MSKFKKHSLATAADLKVGRTVWIQHLGRCQILEGIQTETNHRLSFIMVKQTSAEDKFSFEDSVMVWLGDEGIKGYAYDDRQPRIHTNRRSWLAHKETYVTCLTAKRKEEDVGYQREPLFFYAYDDPCYEPY